MKEVRLRVLKGPDAGQIFGRSFLDCRLVNSHEAHSGKYRLVEV